MLRLRQNIVFKCVNSDETSDESSVEDTHLHCDDIDVNWDQPSIDNSLVSDKSSSVMNGYSADSQNSASNQSNKFVNNVKFFESGQEFCDFKVIVKNCDQMSNRRVEGLNAVEKELTADSELISFEECIDKVINCNDLNQIENILFDKQINNKPKVQKNKAKRHRINQNNNSLKNMDIGDNEIRVLDIEGVVKSESKKGSKLSCLVCDKNFDTVNSALQHVDSFSHLKRKFGDYLKGMDALFTIDSERIGEANIAIARKKELKKLKFPEKEEYFNHGIRLKDGFGVNAYICLQCNTSFENLLGVRKHFQILNDDSLSDWF